MFEYWQFWPGTFLENNSSRTKKKILRCWFRPSIFRLFLFFSSLVSCWRIPELGILIYICILLLLELNEHMKAAINLSSCLLCFGVSFSNLSCTFSVLLSFARFAVSASSRYAIQVRFLVSSFIFFGKICLLKKHDLRG